MNVLRIIAGINKREQWENLIPIGDIRVMLETESVEGAARVKRLRWLGQLQRMSLVELKKVIIILLEFENDFTFTYINQA